MLQKWKGRVVGEMFVNKISFKELAEKAGYDEKYLSQIMNGHRNPKTAKDRIEFALAELVRGRKGEDG